MMRLVLLALCVAGYLVGGGVTLVAMLVGLYAFMLYQGPDEWGLGPAVAFAAMVLASAGVGVLCFAHWIFRRL